MCQRGGTERMRNSKTIFWSNLGRKRDKRWQTNRHCLSHLLWVAFTATYSFHSYWITKGVGHLEKELQRIANEHKRLESELQKLQPEKSFSIEVGVKHERNYGSMSFDARQSQNYLPSPSDVHVIAVCSLARTTDERIAENGASSRCILVPDLCVLLSVSAVARADKITISDLRNELAASKHFYHLYQHYRKSNITWSQGKRQSDESGAGNW